MHIKILGPGCKNCVNLEKEARAAVQHLGLDATVEGHRLRRHRLLRHPAHPGLVVDEEVLVSGRVPKSAEIEQLLAGR